MRNDLNKALKFPFYLFLLCVLCFQNSQAQYSYYGQTLDVLSEKPLANVEITNVNSGELFYSDANGAFSIHAGNPQDPIKFRVIFNVFYSPENENIQLQLFNLNGQKLFHTKELGYGGTYLLPRLPSGMYLLKISSNGKTETFKISCQNQTFFLHQDGGDYLTRPTLTSRSTFVFSKNGYFEQSLSLPESDTSFVIKLFPMEDGDFDFLLTIPNYELFSLLQSSPFVTNQGEVESVKFIYDRDKNRVYFMNSKRHELHYFFAKDFLGYNKGLYHFNAIEYSNSPERTLFPGSINYYKALDKYVLRYYPGDEMGCSKIKEIFDKIVSLSYLKGKLFLYPNNTKWENCADVPIITSEELYEGQNYQALNLAQGFGYLRKLRLDELNTTYLGKHDIVLLNGIPNDVSVVSGIITTEFQTPLSHINVLSHNRGTPNMALRNGWTNERLDTLIGQLVFLEVLSDSFVIRKATIDEATHFWNQNEPQTIVVLDKNISTTGLMDLNFANHSSVNSIGGKAANFAELLKLENPKIPTPENPFAIPFYYYVQHIEQNNIAPFIEQLLNDPLFETDQNYRKQKLGDLREKIKQAPIDQGLVVAVLKQINNFSEHKSYRFRSSTNAEDLEFFSGAGLYDSYSAKEGHQTKTIENAIKKVWASLWNFRAFEERDYYKIDHRSVAMGILVHRSFPNENANGVLITKNLYNRNPGFIVNAQFNEHSIVFPEPGIMHDQIILFAYSTDSPDKFTIEYLSHSNLPGFEGKNVLTDGELQKLGEYSRQIKQHFYQNIPHSCACLFDDFGLDIEFKIDSPHGKRQLYIKQVRIFN